MSESNHTVSPGADPEPEGESSEWSEKRFAFLYAVVLTYTLGTIWALWLFSRIFD